MKKIGILSLYYHSKNYGGQLQARAMVKALEDMGYQAEQVCIDKQQGLQHKPGALDTAASILADKTIVEKICAISIALEKRIKKLWTLKVKKKGREYLTRSERFISFEQETNHSKEVFHPGKIGSAVDRYDVFVTGSDQVWYPKVQPESILKMFGLCFAGCRKRIAYAASMGVKELDQHEKDIFQMILNGMDHISVRERKAAELLQPLTKKEVATVCDPVLLKNAAWWDRLSENDLRQKEPYTFGYFLSGGLRNQKIVKKIAMQFEAPFWCISDGIGAYLIPEGGQVFDAGPKQFIGWIKNSKWVLTDSFHGMVFSVLFHKPFWVFKRTKDNETGSMNSRITDFLSDVGLEDRLLEDGEMPSASRLVSPIDYERVDRILEEKRMFSLNWLHEALEG